MRGKRKKQREIGEGTKCARGGMESQTAVEGNKESRYTIWQEWSKRDQKNKENIREVGMSAMWPVWRSLHPLRYESSQATRARGGWTPGAGPNRTGCSHSRLAGATIKKTRKNQHNRLLPVSYWSTEVLLKYLIISSLMDRLYSEGDVHSLTVQIWGGTVCSFSLYHYSACHSDDKAPSVSFHSEPSTQSKSLELPACRRDLLCYKGSCLNARQHRGRHKWGATWAKCDKSWRVLHKILWLSSCL